MSDDGHPALARLRRLCIVEGVTLVLLVAIAMPLKHVYGVPSAVTIMGSIHGAAFLAFLWAMRNAEGAGLLSPSDARKILVAACIPLGALWIERRLRRP